MNNNSWLFSMFTVLNFSMLSRQVHSEHVLPLFTGLWYDAQRGYNYEGYDACSVVFYIMN